MCRTIERIGIVPLVSLALLLALLALPRISEAAEAEEDALLVTSENLGTDSTDTLDGRGSGASTDQETATEETRTKPDKSRFELHGFLTQAYATGRYVDTPANVASPTFTEGALGIPEDGTTAYRFLALQFRYEITPDDIMIVQLSNRRIGNSPLSDIEDDILLDWAFYERRITDQLRIKVGRVQIPIGIYNEIRDVGTILPFYRPPFNFYGEGSYTSETVDGLLLAHTLWSQSDWNLDVSVYGGEWESFEVHATDPNLNAFAVADNAYGLQLWLNTPVPGLRFGFGGNSKKYKGGVYHDLPEGVSNPTIRDIYASVDATFSRFIFRGEYWDGDSIIWIPLGNIYLNPSFYYGQLGFLINPKWNIWLQYDVNAVDPEGVFYVGGRGAKRNLREDMGISVNYFFAPNVVLKAEYHEVEENTALNNIVSAPGGGVLLDQYSVELPNGNYTIISLSVSF